jgi:hypothetical protein
VNNFVEITIRFPHGEDEVMDFNNFNHIMNIKEHIAKNDMDSYVQRGQFKRYELLQSYPDFTNGKFVYRYKVYE